MSDKLSVRPQQNTIGIPENSVRRDCGGECGSGEFCRTESPTLPVAVMLVEDADEGGGDGGDHCELTVDVEQEVERIATLPTYQPTKASTTNIV